MEINTKKLDELYMKWCGKHHTANSNKPVHDSAECTNFAEFVLNYAMREGRPDLDTSGGLHLACVIKSVCDHNWKEWEDESCNAQMRCTKCKDIKQSDL